jgi:hypothetical protein
VVRLGGESWAYRRSVHHGIIRWHREQSGRQSAAWPYCRNTLQAAHAKGLLAEAVLIGVDVGPNLSITGSLATILWLTALRKEKIDVSFGRVAMPVALLASLLGVLLLMHLEFQAYR